VNTESNHDVTTESNIVTFSSSGSFRERVFETTTLTEITVKSFVTVHKEQIRRVASGQSSFSAVAELKSHGSESASFSESSKDVLTQGEISRDFVTDTSRTVVRKEKSSNSSSSSSDSSSSSHSKVLGLSDSSVSWTHKDFMVSSIPSWLKDYN